MCDKWVPVWKNEGEDIDVVVRSSFLDQQAAWNTKPCRYIYWSGETYLPPQSDLATDHLVISTTLDVPENTDYKRDQNYIYVPFFVFSPYLSSGKLFDTPANQRPHFLAYCHSNPIEYRETVFRKMCERRPGECHAMGVCDGGVPESRRDNIPGHWDSIDLVKAYSQYKFVLAMENKQVEGYITEKILNAYAAGAIPIYSGSSTVSTFFNHEAYINMDDFVSMQACVEYVCSLTDKQIDEIQAKPFFKENFLYTNFFDPGVLNGEKERLRVIFKDFLAD